MDSDGNRNESVRLISFHECQSPYIRPGLLAEGGFFSIGRFGVRCAFCGIEFIDWAEEEILSDHVKYSPSCPVLKKVASGNVPINQQHSDITAQTNNTENTVDFEESLAARRHLFVRDDLNVRPDTTNPIVRTKKTVSRKLCEVCNKHINKTNWWKHVKTTRHLLAVAAVPVAVFAEPSTSIATPTTLEPNTSALPSLHMNIATQTTDKNDNNVNVLEGEKVNPINGGAVGLADEENTRMCKVCYSNELYILFLPCRHIMACESCARCLKTCGICCQKIEQTMRVFIP